jgi:hypothetical protein
MRSPRPEDKTVSDFGSNTENFREELPLLITRMWDSLVDMITPKWPPLDADFSPYLARSCTPWCFREGVTEIIVIPSFEKRRLTRMDYTVPMQNL